MSIKKRHLKLIRLAELGGNISMKKFLIGLFTAATFFIPAQMTFANEVEVPENIYRWVQSTPRGNYYFNFQQTNYAVKADGTIDLSTIIAPTIASIKEITVQIPLPADADKLLKLSLGLVV